MNTTTTHCPLRRGDYALTSPWTSPPERVQVVRAEYLPTGEGCTRERWLHIRFTDGRRLLAHPSTLRPA